MSKNSTSEPKTLAESASRSSNPPIGSAARKAGELSKRIEKAQGARANFSRKAGEVGKAEILEAAGRPRKDNSPHKTGGTGCKN
jgi:hypothetical protein